MAIPSLAELDAEIAQLERSLVKLKQRRNQRIISATLPDDILSTIFALLPKKCRSDTLFTRLKATGEWPSPMDGATVKGRREVQACMSWAAVAWVCQRWRAAALDSPLLWTHTCSVMGYGWRDMTLKRSGTAPLDVQVCVEQTPEITLPLDVQSIPPVCRARSVALSTGMFTRAHITALSTYLCGEAPHLKSLSLVKAQRLGRSEVSVEESIKFADNLSAKIDHLALYHARIPWTSHLYTDLTTLSITLDSADRLHAQNILSILAKSPNLESFTADYPSLMVRAAVSVVDSTQIRKCPAVSLPRLKRLRLSADYWDCVGIMSRLDPPPPTLTSLIMDCGSVKVRSNTLNSRPPVFADLCSVLSHWPMFAQPADGAPDPQSIDLGLQAGIVSHKVYISLQPMYPIDIHPDSDSAGPLRGAVDKLIFSLPDSDRSVPFNGRLASLLAIFPSPKFQFREVMFGESFDYRTILPRFSETLRRVIVYGPVFVSEGFLDMLSEEELIGGSCVARLPLLRHLTFARSVRNWKAAEIDKLTAMLARRRELGSPLDRVEFYPSSFRESLDLVRVTEENGCAPLADALDRLSQMPESGGDERKWRVVRSE